VSCAGGTDYGFEPPVLNVFFEFSERAELVHVRIIRKSFVQGVNEGVFLGQMSWNHREGAVGSGRLRVLIPINFDRVV
jgi:hypothetical protein